MILAGFSYLWWDLSGQVWYDKKIGGNDMTFTIGWIATFGIVVLGVMFVAGGLVHLSSQSEDRKMEKVALDRTIKREQEKFLQAKKNRAK